MKNFKHPSLRRHQTYANLITATLNQVEMLREMLYWKKYTQFLIAVEYGFHWGQGEGSIPIRWKDLKHP